MEKILESLIKHVRCSFLNILDISSLPTKKHPQIAGANFEWCLSTESNCGHKDFQSFALPTELPRQSGDPDGTRTHDLRRDRAAF